MGNIINQNNNLDLIDFDVEELTPRDPRYAIRFLTKSLSSKLSQADAFAESVYNAVIKEASTASQIAGSFQKGSRFVVDMTDSTKSVMRVIEVEVSE